MTDVAFTTYFESSLYHHLMGGSLWNSPVFYSSLICKWSSFSVSGVCKLYFCGLWYFCYSESKI